MIVMISPLSPVSGLVHRYGVGRVLSLLGPAMDPPSLPLPKTHHLTLTFHDVAQEISGYISPNAQHMEALLAFIQGWDQKSPLLIHCFAGISRSTAAAFITMCALAPQREEHLLTQELRGYSAVATPNRRMVALADHLLGRGGKMSAAVDAMGPGIGGFEGPVVHWPVPSSAPTP